jgi:hypothetical protein
MTIPYSVTTIGITDHLCDSCVKVKGEDDKIYYIFKSVDGENLRLSRKDVFI